MILCLVCFPSQGQTNPDPAKQQYLNADESFKKLRNSYISQQRVSAWLNCINQYEAIYKQYPESSWAPAGMYKAAELYLQLFQRSDNRIHQSQGIDLLTRIRNKYPESAYTGRANMLLKSIDIKPAPVETSIKHILSAKQASRNNALMNKFNREQSHSALKTPSPAETNSDPAPPLILNPTPQASQELEQPAPTGDTRITDMRFWSNPEYTRIVINAMDERRYSHRLLKEDPTINIPFPRLYIDIEQTRLGKDIATQIPINDNLLNQARAGQYLPHTVRVVVDIKSFENYKIFSLKDPFRIIIDVWGKGSNGSDSAPPLEQNLVQKEPDKVPIITSRITTDNLRSSDIARQLALGVRKIIIDPGHGGPDPGAPGYVNGVWEKDIVLKLSLNLAEKLRRRLNCTVELTRSTDTKLTLEERTAIANTQRADLFISMHCNAAQNQKLTGFETYILNLATDDQAISVAARENATSKKNISDLEYILSDLMKHAKIEESTRLANDVHKTMIQKIKKKYSDINDHGVKQAPFYVLLGARMPSILIETSFLSNKMECKRLLTQSYRDDICTAITDGIEKYIKATNPKQL